VYVYVDSCAPELHISTSLIDLLSLETILKAVFSVSPQSLKIATSKFPKQALRSSGMLRNVDW